MQVEIIREEKFRDLKTEWNQLLSLSSTDAVYLTWEWLYTWWEIFGDDRRELFIIAVRENRQLTGIAPLVIHNLKDLNLFNFRRIELLGTGEDEKDEVCSNYMDFIIVKGKEKEVLDEIGAFLIERQYIAWDEISLSSISKDSLNLRLLIERFSESTKYKIKQSNSLSCPYIKLTDDWEQYLKSLGDKTRRNIRKDRRVLADTGLLEYETYHQSDSHKYFEDFMALHRKRWESKMDQDAFSSSKFVSFHKKISNLFSQKGWLKISFLKHNGNIIAGSYHFIYNGRLYAYQVGCDAQYDKRFSIGITEFGFNIEDAIRKGCKEYDFYKGNDNSYKWRLAKDKREVRDILIFRKDFKYYLVTGIRYLKTAGRKIKNLCLGKRKA